MQAVVIGPVSPRKMDVITATPAGFLDLDGDTPRYQYRWKRDGQTIAGYLGETLPGAYFEKGRRIVLELRPFDGINVGPAVVSNELLVANTAPFLGGVSVAALGGGVPMRGVPLVATASGANDVDSDAVSVSYQWSVYGAGGSRAAGNGSVMLPGSEFSRAERVSVTAVPNDGQLEGAAVTSSQVTIQNAPPTAPGLGLSPSSPFDSDNLVCTLATPSTDPDGDAVTHAFVWERNGSAYNGATSTTTTSTVPASATVVGETWFCAIEANDGHGGTWSTALSRTIGGNFSSAGGGWWRFRKPIVVAGSSAGAQTNYVVPVIVDTAALIAADKMSATGADIRFATAAGVELPWWLESGLNTVSTKLWVRVSQIPTGGTTVYLHYGNPSATLAGYANNGKATFELFDDFEAPALDTALWAPSQSHQAGGGFYALPVVQGGTLRSYVPGPCCGSGTGERAAQTKSAVTGSRVAEFGMTMNNAPSNYSWKSNLWSVSLGAPATVTTSPLASLTSGWWSNGVQDCGPSNGTYQGRVQVDATAGTFKVYLGGSLCGSVSNVSTTQPWILRFYTAGDGVMTVSLSDFRLRPFVAPEPVAGTPGGEQSL